MSLTSPQGQGTTVVLHTSQHSSQGTPPLQVSKICIITGALFVGSKHVALASVAIDYLVFICTLRAHGRERGAP